MCLCQPILRNVWCSSCQAFAIKQGHEVAKEKKELKKKVVMSEGQFKRALQQAYNEGEWSASHGGMTGCPDYEVRDVMTLGEVFRLLLGSFRATGNITSLPPQLEDLV